MKTTSNGRQRGDRESERYVSPLRYPGGKGKVANYLKLFVLKNSLVGCHYVEPYAGGASVALSLLMEGYVQSIHINDLNRGVYAFWKHLLDDPEGLMARISRAKLSIDEWKRQKEIYANPDAELADLGFAVFYLNRTNRSGIISRGGVIGGNEQLGKWKLDARFDKSSLIRRVGKVAEHRSHITLTMEDAAQLLQSNAVRKESSFLYLDPPYYVKGSGLYDNFYQHHDHVAIWKAIERISVPWIVSYDAAPEILELYSQHPAVRYSLGYSASSVSKGSEVMFFSRGVSLPEVESPAGISIRHVQKIREAAFSS